LQFQPPINQTKNQKNHVQCKKTPLLNPASSIRASCSLLLFSQLARSWRCSALQHRLQSRRRTSIPACRLIRETFSAHLAAAPIICRPGCRCLRAVNFLYPGRALGRDLMVDRQLAQHQHYGGQRRLRRDVWVSVGVLGRRLLLRTRRPHFSDSDRALGRDLVGHRQLAQHQHAVQRPLRRDVRVGVRLLGHRQLRLHG
jgi:hypothetical protein